MDSNDEAGAMLSMGRFEGLLLRNRALTDGRPVGAKGVGLGGGDVLGELGAARSEALAQSLSDPSPPSAVCELLVASSSAGPVARALPLR